MKKINLMLFLALILPSSLSALTLSEALDYAVTHNKNVLAAKEKLNAAGGKVTEARAGFLPSLSAQGSYNYLSLVPAFQVQAPGAGGTTVTRTTYLGANDNYLYRASLNQTLFAWGKVYNAYSIAKLNREIAEQEYRKSVNETVYAATNAYYSSVLAKQLHELSKESYKRIAEHRKAVAERYAVGAASQFELLRASVQVSNFSPAVSKSKNAQEISRISLKNILGMGLGEDMSMEDTIPYEPVEYSIDELLKEAFSMRPEIIQSDIRKKISRKALSVSRAGNMPVITGSAAYNYQNPFYNRVEWVENWSAGVMLTFPFFDGFASSGRISQAKSEFRQSEITDENLKRSIEVEVRQAHLLLGEAQERIDSQKDNLIQAEESVRIAEISYANGAVTNLEVMDTQLALTQAKTNYLQALYDYRIARAALQKASGENYNREKTTK